MLNALDDARCGWGDLAESVDVGHDIMAPFLFFGGGDVKLLCVQVLHAR